MNLLHLASVIASCLILANCTTERPANAPSFHEEAIRSAGYARLYIYSPYNDIGSATWPEVSFNGQKIAALKNGSYSTLLLKPGHYEITTENSLVFSTQGNIHGTLDISDTSDHYLEFDRAYDFYTTVGYMGMPERNFKTKYERWTALSRDQALPEISKCYYVSPYVQNFQ